MDAFAWGRPKKTRTCHDTCGGELQSRTGVDYGAVVRVAVREGVNVLVGLLVRDGLRVRDGVNVLVGVGVDVLGMIAPKRTMGR